MILSPKGQGKTVRSNLFNIENTISIKYSERKYLTKSFILEEGV